MKKILFVVDERKMGGVSIVLENLFRELKEYSFDLLILHNNGTRLQNLDNVNIIYGTSLLSVTDQRLSEIIKRKDFLSLVKKIYLIFLMKTGLIQTTIKKIRNKILSCHYDVEVSFKDGFGTFFVAYGDSDYKIRWIHADYSNNDPGKKYQKTYSHALNQFNQFVAISHSVDKNFNDKYHHKDKTIVIHNLIDKETSLPTVVKKKKKNQLELVTVGRLHPIKGYDRVIRAMAKLKQENILGDTLFKIVGGGEEESKLKQLVKENHLDQNVIFYGKKDKPWNELQTGDLFILSSYSEAFPTTVIESLINHIPVFSVLYSSAREILNDKNAILIENTEDAIYHGLKNILQNPEKLKQLKTNVKNYEYDTKQIKKQLIECLRCEK